MAIRPAVPVSQIAAVIKQPQPASLPHTSRHYLPIIATVAWTARSLPTAPAVIGADPAWPTPMQACVMPARAALPTLRQHLQPRRL